MSRAAAEPFPTAARQVEAARLGMMIFLASEVMLFGGLAATAISLRLQHSQDYATASTELHFGIAGANTAVLLTSSLLVAVAVLATREERPRLTAAMLAGAAALGTVFLVLKGWEYRLEFEEGLIPHLSHGAIRSPVQRLFMGLYFIATGLHALHLTIGITLLALLAGPPGKAARSDRRAVLVGNAGLYWHLVDIIWVFLYPILYLARP